MSYTPEQMTPLVYACIGRRDDYAIQRENGLYRRVGQPLTFDLLRKHLVGDLTLGTYVIDERGRCRFAVFDADSEDGVAVLLALQGRLRADGVSSYLEASRRGAHLWVFLARAAPAWVVRGWLLPYRPAGVEFYPKQDTASHERPGSLVRVPLGVHRRSGRRYPFVEQQDGRLVPVARSVSASLSWLATVERVAIPATARVAATGPQAHKKYPSKTVSMQPVRETLTIRDWCLAHNPLVVIGRFVVLDSRGMGCCPFGWHHRAGRDRHPSLWVYVPHEGDLMCWYCHTWQQGGSLFDFLRLYSGLDARELWRRIRAGEQFC
ncbi:MAG TPA: hypothetical protein VJ761_08000 [Ktedonobacteraceae bacterium]|nr:hypothetical protein [Ktedonobacteraceae bacterium]